MKTAKNVTATILKATLILSLVFMTSCNKDDDNNDTPADLFASLPSASLTTYTGDLTYAGSAGTIIVTDTATATISGSGTTYSISFSDGAPSITSVRFALVNGTYITTGASNIVITVDGSDLSIQAQQGGNNWVFDGER